MSRAAQDPPRLTRSMAVITIRRSARLRGDDPEKRPRSSLQSSSVRGQTDPDIRHGIKKRKRSSMPVEGTPRKSKSRRECGKVEVQVERRTQLVSSRDNVIYRESSSRTGKAACDQGSSREQELEEQLDKALLVKQELAAEVQEHKINFVRSALKHLEEYFTCPLCFEVMACPYALIPRNCGHTFCATCILKWFFSRLHKGCGGWHEAVDCPMCRSSLPHTPERTPRSTSCFPFTPNRTADGAIRGFINTISRELATASTLVSHPLSDWDEDGHSRQEWSKRERAGRIEMTSIAAQWNTLKPTDFVNIKNRLGV